MQLVAECIALHKVQQLEALLGPVATATGNEYKSPQVQSTSRPAKRTRRPTELNREDPDMMKRAQQRDSAMLMALRAQGIPVEKA